MLIRIAVLLLTLVGTLFAAPQMPSTTALTGAEKEAVKDVIDMMKGVLGPDASTTFRSLSTLTNPQNYYYIYTLSEGLDEMTALLGADRIRTADIGGAAHYDAPGLDGDLVVLDAGRVATATGGAKVARAKARLALALNLANELTHFMQSGGFSDLETCRRERDSDSLSILFGDKLLAALSSGGVPHGSLAAVAADPDGGAAVAKAIAPTAGEGAWTAAELAEVYAELKELVDGYKRRRTLWFDSFLAPPAQSWAAYYRDGGAWKEKPKAGEPIGRSAYRIVSRDGTVTQSYSVPVGRQLVSGCAATTTNGTCYLGLSTYGSSNLAVEFRTDSTGDALPEAAITGTVTLTGIFGDPGLWGMGLYPSRLPALGGESLVAHDLASGSVWIVPLDAQGVPLVASAAAAFQSPTLTFGAYEYLIDVFETSAGVVRFVFLNIAPAAALVSSPARWFDFNVGANTATAGAANMTLADAHAPFNDAGHAFVLGNAYLQFCGNPGAAVGATRMDVFPQAPFTTQVNQPGGLSMLVPVPPTLLGPVHIKVSDNLSSEIFFLPPLGRPLDRALVDIDTDGDLDRLDRTVAPERLFLSIAQQPAPGATVFQPLYEMVLESEGMGRFALPLNAGVVTLASPTADHALQRIPGSMPPLYAQSLADLDGDLAADDTVVIRRQNGAGGFSLDVLENALTAPLLAQTLLLPLGFIPSAYEIIDVDQDGDLDVAIGSYDAAGGVRAVNGGGGLFVLDLDPLYPGSGEDFGMTIAVNASLPPSQDLIGVDAGDILTLTLTSPFSTFTNYPILVAGQEFIGQTPQPGIPAFGLQLNPVGIPAPFLLIDPLALPLVGSPLLLPGGSPYSFTIPLGLPQVTVMLQALVLTPTAQNGFFATSSGTAVRIE